MRRRRRLNIRGKIAVTILLTITVIMLSVLVGGGKDEAKEKDSTIHATSHAPSLEMLSVSFEPMVAFADSTLNQPFFAKKSQKKENARLKAVAKQKKVDQLENAIYLTFDDGPSNVSDQLLDILDDYQMKATFFMLGPNMQDHPEVVKRMQNDGFGLALHGITHKAGEIYSSPYAPVEEMTEGQEILENLTGVHSNLIRLPYGSVPYLTENMRYLLDQNDFNIWDWNIDSRDWELKDERYVQHTIQKIQQMEQAGETPVILLHDKPEIIKYLPELLYYIKKQGYKTKVLTNDMAPVTFPCEGRCHPIN
ncbi:polysaccharide deacetylase family protein [Rossellomorea sp. BNER]|uniref:polysaccharide deacetylase family protein n=1 Tax=Rossellomorea sp. BNER TaxID=2962031 RepID=UPI003AF1E7C3|nr:polysaccharide deacetylase [Rossellomorea sp. BNER]